MKIISYQLYFIKLLKNHSDLTQQNLISYSRYTFSEATGFAHSGPPKTLAEGNSTLPYTLCSLR